MLDLKSIICAGYSCILHLQAMAEEVGNTLPTVLRVRSMLMDPDQMIRIVVIRIRISYG